MRLRYGCAAFENSHQRVSSRRPKFSLEVLYTRSYFTKAILVRLLDSQINMAVTGRFFLVGMFRHSNRHRYIR